MTRSTPWGPAHTVTNLADGFDRVTTAIPSNDRTSDKIKKGKELLAALKAKKEEQKRMLDRYTAPKYDKYYNQPHLTSEN